MTKKMSTIGRSMAQIDSFRNTLVTLSDEYDAIEKQMNELDFRQSKVESDMDTIISRIDDVSPLIFEHPGFDSWGWKLKVVDKPKLRSIVCRPTLISKFIHGDMTLLALYDIFHIMDNMKDTHASLDSHWDFNPKWAEFCTLHRQGNKIRVIISIDRSYLGAVQDFFDGKLPSESITEDQWMRVWGNRY